MNSSRKSSASSTCSARGSSKPTTSTKVPPLDLGSKKSQESKEPLSKNYSKLSELGNSKVAKSEKKSYLDNTENDIEKDKETQRYNILMKKLNEVSLEKDKSKSKQSPAATSKSLNPIVKKSSLVNSHPDALKSPKSTESQAKNGNQAVTKQNGSNQNKNEESESDNDENDRAVAVKAPNELLEEVIFIFFSLTKIKYFINDSILVFTLCYA